MNTLGLLQRLVLLIENYSNRDEIRRLAMEIITSDLNFAVAGVFSVHDNIASDAIVSGSNALTRIAGRLIGTTFSSLKFDLANPSNIMAKAASLKQTQLTQKASDFVPGMSITGSTLDRAMNTVMRLYGMQELAVVPCLYQGVLKGMIVVGHPQKFNEEELITLDLVASQLAAYLSFADLTADFELKNKELQDTLQKEKDMLDILGHELRTPLSIARNAILVVTDKFNKKTLSDDNLTKYLPMAVEHLEQEAKLLETMLLTTKIENNQITISHEDVDVIDVINDTLAALDSFAKEKSLQLIFNKPDACHVYADRQRLLQVIDNLIDNAIKYTPKGSVTVTVSSDQQFATISVQDTGKGIPAEEIPKLGNKFYRVENYTSSSAGSDMKIVRAGGTGLGLYVTFSLVRAMGGEIKVISQVGKGSTFAITLPLYTGQTIDGESHMTVKEKFEAMKKEQTKSVASDQQSPEQPATI